MRTRTFAIGMALVIVACLLLFVGIHAANSGTHRPEGTAERWLAAVSDTSRKGVRSDAIKRAEKLVEPEVSSHAAALHRSPFGIELTSQDALHDGKRSFTSLEVGKAKVQGSEARVPYLLRKYVSSGEVPDLKGIVVLARAGGGWRVAALADATGDAKVPSEGGAPPSSAPKSYWLFALLLGVVITAICSALINLAGRGARTGAVAPVA